MLDGTVEVIKLEQHGLRMVSAVNTLARWKFLQTPCLFTSGTAGEPRRASSAVPVGGLLNYFRGWSKHKVLQTSQLRRLSKTKIWAGYLARMGLTFRRAWPRRQGGSELRSSYVSVYRVFEIARKHKVAGFFLSLMPVCARPTRLNANPLLRTAASRRTRAW